MNNQTKRNLKDYALQVLRELISPAPAEPEKPVAPPKRTLADLKLEDLNREKLRLDRKEQEFMQRLQGIEQQKLNLFEQGVRSGSEVEQSVIARRIKELDEEVQSVNTMLQTVSKQKRLVHGLMLAEERARLLSRTGLTELGQIDLAELITHIEDISLESDVQDKNIDDLLRVLGKSKDLSPKQGEDAEVLKIMQAMQRTREAADNPDAIGRESMKQALNSVSKSSEQADLDSLETR
ncbi:MAG: hypothetical protein MUC85_01905 [Anaerolineales bacterium]|jgi:hypothetical protein|nr:hypothetical protein [Anaerolineales bacterium]